MSQKIQSKWVTSFVYFQLFYDIKEVLAHYWFVCLLLIYSEHVFFLLCHGRKNRMDKVKWNSELSQSVTNNNDRAPTFLKGLNVAITSCTLISKHDKRECKQYINLRIKSSQLKWRRVNKCCEKTFHYYFSTWAIAWWLKLLSQNSISIMLWILVSVGIYVSPWSRCDNILLINLNQSNTSAATNTNESSLAFIESCIVALEEQN